MAPFLVDPIETSFEMQLAEAKAKHPPNPEHGVTSLHVAALNDDLSSVDILLRSGEFSVTETCHHGGTALTYAAWNTNNPDLVDLLLQHPCGSEALNAPDNDGFTPLICAAHGNNLEVVSALLAHEDIDVFAKEYNYGDTALDKAVGAQHEDCERLLREYLERNLPLPSL